MGSDAYRLGVDFGTSSTVAMLASPDGRIRPLLFDASPLLSSAVCAAPAVAAGPAGAGPAVAAGSAGAGSAGAGPAVAAGSAGAGPAAATLLTGADALRASALTPAGYEATPKRRIDDGTVWLDERAVEVVDLVAAVLARVDHEARRVAGGPVERVMLTRPAGWGRARSEVLLRAAWRVGWRSAELVSEPVAAAVYFATVLGHQVQPGRCLVVYDLGAGTFDVSVVRRHGAGFTVVASAGLTDVGGVDLDAAVVAHARTATPQAADVWRRLDWPQTAADQRARHRLWLDARAAKEQLSRHAATVLYVPLAEVEVWLTREEFERAAAPLVDRTAQATLRLLRDSSVPPEQIAGVFLVGGGSRIPLAATLLHRTLRIAPTAIEQPELVVAEGSLHLPAGSAGAGVPDESWTAGHPPLPGPFPPAGVEPSAPVAPERSVPVGSGPFPPVALEPPVPVGSERSVPVGSGPFPPVAPEPSVPVGPEPAASSGPERSTPDAASGPRLTRRNALLAGALGTAAATAGVLGAWRWWPGTGPITGARAVEGGLSGHTDWVWAVAFSPDGKLLASGGGDGTVRLWDMATRQPSGEALTGHAGPVWAVAFSPDGKLLVSGGQDALVRFWDVSTRKPIATRADADWTRCAAFSRDGKLLATAGVGDSVRLWDVSTRQRLDESLAGGTGEVYAVAFSGRQDLLAAGGGSGTVQLWSVVERRAVGAPLTSGTGTVRAVAFSPDGTRLAAGGDQRSIQVWSTGDGKTDGDPITGYDWALYRLAFGPGGRELISAGGDGTVRLWNARTHQPIGKPLSGPGSMVLGLAYAPGGDWIAASGSDPDIRLWRTVR